MVVSHPYKQNRAPETYRALSDLGQVWAKFLGRSPPSPNETPLNKPLGVRLCTNQISFFLTTIRSKVLWSVKQALPVFSSRLPPTKSWPLGNSPFVLDSPSWLCFFLSYFSLTLFFTRRFGRKRHCPLSSWRKGCQLHSSSDNHHKKKTQQTGQHKERASQKCEEPLIFKPLPPK